MPTVITDVESLFPPAAPRRKRWTREEVDALASTGLFDQQRLELIEGELIDKMGKKRPHVNSSVRLHAWLMAVFGVEFVIQEGPIDVAPEDNPTNEPEPDVVVLARGISHFPKDNPRPDDLRLVVEIADTSVPFDMNTKAALYARAGIAEYWVLDIPGRRMIVHRAPQNGRYTSITAHGAGESVAPLAAPNSPFRVADAFVD